MEVAGANRRYRLQFRYRGSRRESAVAQLFSLGIVEIYAQITHHRRSSFDSCICHGLLEDFEPADLYFIYRCERFGRG
jgi:hypothetical protein